MFLIDCITCEVHQFQTFYFGDDDGNLFTFSVCLESGEVKDWTGIPF